MDRVELERLDRESLVLRAQAAGIKRARILTRPELVDELLRLDPNVDPERLRRTRGFFGRARDLLNKVVERGLHLPDAAERLVSALGTIPENRPEPQAIPTVTLAEIYAAQGHKQRAIETLRRVLEREPEHVAARALLERLEAKDYVPPPQPLPPEPDVEPALAEEEQEEDDEESTERLVAIDAPPPTPHVEIANDIEPPADDEPTTEDRPLPPVESEIVQTATVEMDVVPELSGEELGDELSDDVCVAVPLASPGTMRVVWRLRTRPSNGNGVGSFVVRAIVIEPTWNGPSVQTRDEDVSPSDGERVLEGLPQGAIVRVAVGYLKDGSFAPLAHSPAFELRDGRVMLWTMKGLRPLSFDDLEPEVAGVFAQASVG